MFRDRVLQHYREKGYALRERVQVRGASGTVHACDLVAQGPLGNLVVQFEDYGGFEGPELDAVRRIARDVGATPVVAAETVSQSVRRHAAQTGVVVLDADALAARAPSVVAVAASGGQEPDHPPWPGQAPRDGEARPRPELDRPAREWPDDALARPRVSPRMDPAEVDDLVQEWTRPALPRPTRREDPGFWRYQDGPGPAAQAAQPEQAAGAVTGFSWLERDEQPLAPLPHETPGPVGSEPVRTRQAPREQAAAVDLRWLVGFAVAGASAGAAFLGLGVLLGVL